MMALAERLGVDIPRSVTVAAAGARTATAHGLSFPLVIKPFKSRVATASGWIYTAVTYAHDAAELQRTLGALLDYDHKQNADLIKTLEAFFECHGNLSQTAEALIVHRNTLLYRMSRINEIAQIDLERPEIRLGLHLALAIRRLLPPQ